MKHLQPALEYFGNLRVLPPPNVLYVSPPLPVELKSMLVLGVIESLWWSLDEERLGNITQEAEVNLKFCEGYEILEKSCRSLIGVLSQMIESLKGNLLYPSALRREAILDHHEEFALYFSWLYQEYTLEQLLQKISKNYQKVLEIYTIQGDQVQLSARVGQPSPRQHGFEKIICLNNGSLPHCILYEYTPYQVDNIIGIISKAQRSVRFIKDQLGKKDNELTDALQQAGKTTLELKELQVQVKSSQRKLRQCEDENHRLGCQIKELNTDKERLEKQCLRMGTENDRRNDCLAQDLHNTTAELERTKLAKKFIDRQLEKIEQQIRVLQSENETLKAQIKIKCAEKEQAVKKETQSQSLSGPDPSAVKLFPVGTNKTTQNTARKLEPSNVIQQFGGKGLQFELVKCQICQEVKEDYRLFQCSHSACKDCLLNNIQKQITNDSAQMKCPHGCGAGQDHIYLARFLEDAKQRDLLEKYNRIKIHKTGIVSTEKLATCPQCKETLFVQKENQFLLHCQQIWCLKCGENHDVETRCSQTHLLETVKALERPLVCPQCLSVFDMDDKCKHVVCPQCGPKNIQPEGICPICSVLRSPIKAHDNSYHRSDCQFYSESHDRQRYLPDKCENCKRDGRACDRPAETFKNFIKNNLGRQMYKHIEGARRIKPLKYAQPHKK